MKINVIIDISWWEQWNTLNCWIRSLDTWCQLVDNNDLDGLACYIQAIGDGKSQEIVIDVEDGWK